MSGCWMSSEGPILNTHTPASLQLDQLKNRENLGLHSALEARGVKCGISVYDSIPPLPVWQGETYF